MLQELRGQANLTRMGTTCLRPKHSLAADKLWEVCVATVLVPKTRRRRRWVCQTCSRRVACRHCSWTPRDRTRAGASPRRAPGERLRLAEPGTRQRFVRVSTLRHSVASNTLRIRHEPEKESGELPETLVVVAARAVKQQLVRNVGGAVRHRRLHMRCPEMHLSIRRWRPRLRRVHTDQE